MNPIILLIGLFFLLCLLKVPIAFSLAASSILTIIYIDLPLRVVVNQIYQGLNLFPLLAIPFFLMVGYLMNSGNITWRLVKLSQNVVGHIKGGLAYVNVIVSMLFAGISGSSAADTAGVGAILIPAMEEEGYDKDFAVAITAASSTMGVIIPPSIYMVVYGAMGGVSIGALFLAGTIPGILIGLSQLFYSYYLAKKHNFPSHPKPELKEVLVSIKEAFLPLLMPFLIIGGVIGGIFTATEAGAVAVAYGLFLTLFVYRSIKFRELPKLLKETASFFPIPLFAIASAGLFGWLITFLNGPQYLANLFQALNLGPTGTLLILCFILILVGTFMSPVAAILIFLPVVQELGAIMGYQPVHLGVVVVVSLALGLITPPYGLCILIATGIGKISMMRALKEILPLILLFILIIVLTAVFPELVMYLPRLIAPNLI